MSLPYFEFWDDEILAHAARNFNEAVDDLCVQGIAIAENSAGLVQDFCRLDRWFMDPATMRGMSENAARALLAMGGLVSRADHLAVMAKDAEINRQYSAALRQIADQQKEIRKQRKAVAAQKRQIVQQQSAVSELKQLVAEQKDEIARQQKTIASRENQILEKENEIAEIKKLVLDLKAAPQGVDSRSSAGKMAAENPKPSTSSEV
ncbi:MAG: hypothetical protein JSW39_14775 [Desulfobacterales bacterium]|nr:MAG: hypothetical protein JSW39_14775 [Desulfobacterales bacterium]